MSGQCETAEEIQEIDAYVRRLEGERNIPCGAIQFDLIIETARGIVNVEKIATASPRIAQMTTGQCGNITLFPELTIFPPFYDFLRWPRLLQPPARLATWAKAAPCSFTNPLAMPARSADTSSRRLPDLNSSTVQKAAAGDRRVLFPA